MCLAAPFYSGLYPFPVGGLIQNRGGDRDEIPDVFLCVFVVTVAGVKVAMVFVVLQGIEGTAGIEDKFIGIDVRQVIRMMMLLLLVPRAC